MEPQQTQTDPRIIAAELECYKALRRFYRREGYNSPWKRTEDPAYKAAMDKLMVLKAQLGLLGI